MKIIHCPVNGPRPLQEFYFGGQFRAVPPSEQEDAMTDAEWSDYAFNRDGSPGIQKEWWYHTPSGTWFIAERDIVTDAFVRTYLFDQADQESGNDG